MMPNQKPTKQTKMKNKFLFFLIVTIDTSLLLLVPQKTDALALPAAAAAAGASQQTQPPPFANMIAFKHLYRHYDDVSFDSFLRCMEPYEFLQSVFGYNNDTKGGGGEEDEDDDDNNLVVDRMIKDYPALLHQNVHAQLAPKVQFLVHNLGGGTGRLLWVDDDDDNDDDKNENKNDEEEATESPLPSKQTTNMIESSVVVDVNVDDEECQPFHDDDHHTHHHSLRVSRQVMSFIPTALFFGCRLDRSVGPRHAYLQYYNLPHGDALWAKNENEDNNKNNKLTQFLQTCHSKSSSSAADFAALCNQWQQQQDQSSSSGIVNGNNLEANSNSNQQQQPTFHTAEQVQAFEQAFGPGLIPCAKAAADAADDDDDNDESHKERFRFDPESMIHLLLAHGANYAEKDRLGRSPLHWAAGTGKVAAVQALLQHAISEQSSSLSSAVAAVDVLLQDMEYKEGATPFHWACCGARPGKIGYGGSYDVCRVLLESCSSSISSPDDQQHCQQLRLVNAKTFSNSTPLMWAAWAGSLAIVDLLAIHKADPLVVDSKGATVAHWATAGGHVKVCQYLHENLGVDFVASLDKNGRSPLDIALEYDRQDVVEWIREMTYSNVARQDGEAKTPSSGQQLRL